MAKQTINLGATANDGTGDPLRTAFDKSNDNFTELYAQDSSILVSLDSDEAHIARLDSDLRSMSDVVKTKEIKITGDETESVWIPHLTASANGNLLIKSDTANGEVGWVGGQSTVTIGPGQMYDNSYYNVNLGGPVATSEVGIGRISLVPPNNPAYNHDVRRFQDAYFEALDVDDIMMGGNGTLHIGDSSELEIYGRTIFRGKVATVPGPTTSIGAAGDKATMLRFDNDYIYRCVADYDGTTNIWRRTAWEESSW